MATPTRYATARYAGHARVRRYPTKLKATVRTGPGKVDPDRTLVRDL